MSLKHGMCAREREVLIRSNKNTYLSLRCVKNKEPVSTQTHGRATSNKQ